MPNSIYRRLTAEGVGTAMLLATVVGSGIMADNLANGSIGLALLCNAIATGAILYVLITVLGSVSGAHFNPAVTLAMWLRKEINTADGMLYVVVQIVTGIVGVFAAHAMFDLQFVQFSQTARTGLSQWFSEFVAAFGLVFAILGALRVKPDAVATSVGLFILSAYWFTASTSFANPAVTIARAFTDTFAGIAPVDVFAFVVAQLIGAAVATYLAGWLFVRD